MVARRLGARAGGLVDPGDLIEGRYRLLRPVGKGAMGTVWAAHHELLDRDVALKLASVSGPEARERFLREGRIVGKLSHPNVVAIADVGEVAPGGGLYLAMELLEGETLAERIAAGPPLSPVEALAITGEVCRGLAAAHAAGVVHRDLKPENVFLARGAGGGVVPKLVDFGVSLAHDISSEPGAELAGTPAYMSPEQALGACGDRRTDLWSLGVVLYEMLTGAHPFVAASYPALLPLIIEAPYPPLPPSVPVAARTVVAGCLAKDPCDRYPSADALRAAIERALTELRAHGDPAGLWVEATVAPVSAPRREAEPPQRRPRLSLMLAALAVPVLVGVAAIASSSRRPEPKAPAASPAASVPLPRAPDPPPTASAAPTSPPAPAVSSAPAPSQRPRPAPSGRAVSKINSAGF